MKTIKRKLEKIVGRESVFNDPALLDGFATDCSGEKGYRPVLVVKINSHKQVKRIIHLANRESFSLVPVSSGGPRQRGGIPCRNDKSVILDLQSMTEIEWINRRNRVAVIEAGVTFEQLQPALAREGLRTMAPLQPKQNKSVLACYWEREALTTPRFQWDAMDPITSLEMIQGSGESLFAGEIGTLKGSKKRQRQRGYAHKHPFGILTLNVKKLGSAAQGAMGICPWAAIRCECLPDYEEVFSVSGQNLKDLAELTHQLVYSHLADDIYILNSLNLACLLEQDKEEILNLSYSLPSWTLIFSITGTGALPSDMFTYKNTEFKNMISRSNFSLNKIAPDKINCLIRTSSADPYWKIRLSAHSKEVFFQTAIRKSPGFVSVMEKIIEKHNFPLSQLGVYIQPERQGSCCHLEFNLHCLASEGSGKKMIDGLVKEATTVMMQQGAFFSRPNGITAEYVYSHSGQISRQLCDLKNMFDPNGILQTGQFQFSKPDYVPS